MAEYIERDKLVAAILQLKSELNTGLARRNLKQSDIMRVIAEFPVADVAPVVRCDNCRHMKLLDGVVRFCKIWNAPNGLGAEGYCSYGEKRG